jgi:hypothetical protein
MQRDTVPFARLPFRIRGMDNSDWERTLQVVNQTRRARLMGVRSEVQWNEWEPRIE